MKRYISTAAFAAAILLSGVSFDALMAPAIAQDEPSIDFATFHDALAPYGAWVYSDRWGEVWIPQDVPDDFRPYDTNGYWANTDEYGWTWVSNYEWGDIPFHYGRWVNDPDAGWLWIPGYVWSPGWVVWRSNGRYTGWMPAPPDRQFLGNGGPSGPSFGISFGSGIGISIDLDNTGDYYGYSQWYGRDYDDRRFADNWVFVGTGHMGDRYSDRRRYEAPRGDYVTIIHNSRNTTNYTVVNNYIVNKSVDVRAVERAGGRPVPAVHVADVIRKPQFIMRADQGKAVQTRMREERPRGTGVTGSAPKPSAQIVQSLSTKVPPRGEHPGAHLYTRETVTKAPLAAKPPGPTNAPENAMAPGNKMGAPGTESGGGMTGERDRHMHTPPTTNGPATTGPAASGPTPATVPGTEAGGGMKGEHEKHMRTPPGGTAPTTAGPTTTGPTMTGPATTPPEMMHHHNNETGGPATTPPATTTPEMMRHHETGGPANPTTPTATPPATGTPRMMGHHENAPNAEPPVVHTQPVVHTPPKTPPTKPEPDKKHEHDDTKPQ